MDREIMKGSIDILLLVIISKKEMYGYELVSELNRKGKSFNIKEGTLYPILYRLEDDDLMETHWEHCASHGRPRKYYSVSEKGKQVMAESYSQWKDITQDIMRIMEDLV